MADRPIIDPGENPYLYGQSLPMMPPGQPPITEMDCRKVDPPPLFRVRPPEGAPNVVIVLMDQSCYADPADVRRADPHADVGTAGGERGDVHRTSRSTPLCSPTRTALLTGRNSHQNSMAGVTGTSTAFPGDTGVRPLSMSTVGTMLRRGATAPATSARTTRSLTPRSTSAARSTVGRRAAGSTSSTATSPVSSRICSRA